MVNPILAGDVIKDRHRDLLREAEYQRLSQCFTSSRRSWAASLRVSAATALLALRARLIPGRRAAIQPPVSCVCYIDNHRY